jgi:hypothetical protein
MSRWNRYNKTNEPIEVAPKIQQRIDEYKILIRNILGYDLPWVTFRSDGVNLGKAELEHEFISEDSVELLYQAFRILNLPIRRGKYYKGCRFVMAFMIPTSTGELSIYVRH